MTNSECVANPGRCGALCLERRDAERAKVERVVLNALEKTAARPPDIRAFDDHTFIVFGEADPLLIA